MIDQKDKKRSSASKIVYVLNGDPSHMGTLRFGHGFSLEGVRSAVMRDTICLEGQHELPLLNTNKPIGLYITFYFEVPQRKSNRNFGKQENDYQYIMPNITNCIKYVELVAKNVIYADSAVIAHIDAQKRYDENPRTEFYFRELV